MSSVAASDLERRVPILGMADCRLRKEEAPARIVRRWRERGRVRERERGLRGGGGEGMGGKGVGGRGGEVSE